MSPQNHLHRLNTVAVHLALLKNGKALLFSGSHEKLWDWTKGEANIWNPNDPDGSEESNLRRNLFCSGHCFLPDGKLLVVGGQSTFNFPHVILGTVLGVLPLALKLLGKETADHDIHTFNPKEHFEHEIETINPPYMTSENRPQINNHDDVMQYDTSYEIRTDSSNISKVSLIRMSSTTHNNNMDQRCLFLKIVENSGNTIKIQSPKDGSWAPPGYYLIFIVNNNGIPSVGKPVRIGVYQLKKKL